MFDRAALGLSVVGGLCLLGILATVATGVAMRYLFNQPLLGVNEIVQLTAVALVMSSLPYCTARGEHVAVDVFDSALGAWGRLIGDLLSRAISVTMLAVLTHRAALKALDAAEWGDATNMLRLPLWPYYAVLSAGAALTAAVFLLQFVVILRAGPRR